MSDNKKALPFDKNNFKKMFLCLAVIVLGFILMSLDTATFGFGFLGLTLGPITVLVGFAMGFWAILSKSNSKEDQA